MEQSTPRHSLADVKRLISEGRFFVTRTAFSGANMLGFSLADILDTAQALERRDFYKSMTSHRDHRIWMDVYHPQTSAGPVYLKLTIDDNAVILSFKEL